MHSPQLGRVALLMAVLGALVAMFSLAAAAGNNPAWAQHYNTLLWGNVGIIVGLLIIVLALLIRLLLRLRKARFGARLTLKFATAFAALGVLPGVLVYLVSVLFLSQSIDSWFNVKVDAALDAGLELSRAAIQSQLQTLTQKARTAAAHVNEQEAGTLGQQVQQIRAQYGDVDVLFFTAEPRVLASTGYLSAKGLLTDTPVGENLNVLKRQSWFAHVESVPNADGDSDSERLNLRAAVLVPKHSEHPQALYLQMSQGVSAQVAQWAQTVALGSKNYEALSLGRTGLRKIYGVTLTLTMLLSILAAVTTGFVLADAMSAPLLRLARGTQAVAAGDFSALREPSGQDDLAVLTRSFNRMLFELSSARSGLTQSKQYLEQVLSNLSTGVLVVDSKLGLRSINPSAQLILDISQPQLDQAAQAQFPAAVWQAIVAQGEQTVWQTQLEMSHKNGEIQTLLLRGARLAQPDGDGVLLVFDDVSELILAQKAQAWGEVARRLAHEIKNPLTPIQLSAERLMMKLGDRLEGSDAELLKRSTHTIVAQVTALKNMVDEFRQYARLPQAKLAPLHMNECLAEVLRLYKASPIVLHCKAAHDLILADANQIRQILHNVLGNAIEATQLNESKREAIVVLETQDTEQGFLLRVSDNGPGFSAESLAKLFEPYHTTKAQGTGLGLAIVHRIVQDHHAKIKVKNRLHDTPNHTLIKASAQDAEQMPSTGAIVEMTFPLYKPQA